MEINILKHKIPVKFCHRKKLYSKFKFLYEVFDINLEIIYFISVFNTIASLVVCKECKENVEFQKCQHCGFCFKIKMCKKLRR